MWLARTPVSYAPHSRPWIAVALALYGAILAIIAARLPLWTDESLQLIGSRARSLTELLQWVRINPGGTPVGYLTQAAFLRAFGDSLLSARASSILFSLLSCVAVLFLAQKLRLRRPWLAFAIFMLLPLQFRYGFEGRPYAQALFFSLAATLLLLSLAERPAWWKGVAYAVCIAAGMYTQPYSAFTAIGHVAWAALHLRPRTAVWIGAALTAGGVLFLPWYLLTYPSWATAVAREGDAFHISARFPLLLLRELAGGGYLCTLLLVIAAAFSLRSSRSALLLWGAVCATAGALASDAAWHYFFAIRQVIFVTPALAILAASGIDRLARTWPFRATLLAAGVLLTCLVHDVRMLQRDRPSFTVAITSPVVTVP